MSRHFDYGPNGEQTKLDSLSLAGSIHGLPGEDYVQGDPDWLFRARPKWYSFRYIDPSELHEDHEPAA